MLSDSRLRDAELAILNAPFEEGGWERAVESIAAATGSASAQLLGIGGPLLLPLNVFTGAPASFQHYIRDPQLHGACNWRIGSTRGVMTVQHEADYQAYRALHDTEDYDDAASDMDIPYGCQSALLLDRENLLGLALMRSRRDGPCDAETLTRFTSLRHQLARAVRMQIALDGEAAELMVGDLGALHGATLLLNRHGNLCALTPAAEPMLEDGGPLLLSGLRVRMRDPQENRLFQHALGRLLASDGRSETLVHQGRVGRSADLPHGAWALFITRLPHRSHGLGFDAQVAVSLKPVDAKTRPEAG
jgi:hypothetical protein